MELNGGFVSPRQLREKANVARLSIARYASGSCDGAVAGSDVARYEAGKLGRRYDPEKYAAIADAYEHLDEMAERSVGGRPASVQPARIDGRWLERQVGAFVRESAVPAEGVPESHVLLPSGALFDLGRRILLVAGINVG